jgi:hypothetical protein
MSLLEGGQERGDKIGEALADAGAGLDHEMAALGNGLGDGVGHLKLLRPCLIVAQPLRDGAVRAEDIAMRHGFIVGAKAGRG